MKTKNENRNHREERRQTESAPDAFEPSVVSFLKETDMKIGSRKFNNAVAREDLARKNRKIAALKSVEKHIEDAVKILDKMIPQERFDDVPYLRSRLLEILECDGGEAGLRAYIKIVEKNN